MIPLPFGETYTRSNLYWIILHHLILLTYLLVLLDSNSIVKYSRTNKQFASARAAMTEDMVYTIRSALLALPGRLAVNVVRASTAAEASEIIRSEVHEIMRELSTYKYDPKKYEERVRERKSWEMAGDDGDDDE